MTKDADTWVNMPRKQQELVLNVWRNVLQEVKYGIHRHEIGFGIGFFEPKPTPFDAALKALTDLAGTPLYTHPCPGCVFLGSYDREFDKVADLYFCNQGERVKVPHLTARWGNSPNDADRGEPCEAADAKDVVDKSTSSDFLLLAKSRAVERGLLSGDDSWPSAPVSGDT